MRQGDGHLTDDCHQTILIFNTGLVGYFHYWKNNALVLSRESYFGINVIASATYGEPRSPAVFQLGEAIIRLHLQRRCKRHSLYRGLK